MVVQVAEALTLVVLAVQVILLQFLHLKVIQVVLQFLLVLQMTHLVAAVVLAVQVLQELQVDLMEMAAQVQIMQFQVQQYHMPAVAVVL
jgi:hypothetical protein